MTHSLLAVAMAATGLVASSIAAPEGRQRPPAERASEARAITVHASVLDAKGQPVAGLDAEAFAVREDNVAREVLKVGPATEPLHIALLVDDSEAAAGAIPHMREALTAFVEAMHDKAQIAIITVGERPTSVTQYTNSLDTLKQGVNRIFSRSGTGAYLTEAISEASRGLSKREGTRRAIVALTIEAVEFSNLFANQVLDELDQHGVTLHVIGLGTSNPRMNDEMRNRNIVLVEGSDRTGGRRDTLVTPMSFPDRLKNLAAELSHQDAITYSRPDALIPPDHVAVSARQPGLTVRAARRAPASAR
jgi:VWFA-related protein